MKTLSLNTPYMLVMVGAPGTGKTFFAEKFSNTLQSPLVSHEQIADLLFSKHTLNTEEEDVVERIAWQQMHELFKTKKAIIVDGFSHSRAEREKLLELAHSHHYKTLYIWVQTDTLTAKKRVTKPATGEKRKLLTEEQHRRALQRFHAPRDNDKPIVISGKHTYATQVKVVLKRIIEAHPAVQPPVKKITRPGSAKKRKKFID